MIRTDTRTRVLDLMYDVKPSDTDVVRKIPRDPTQNNLIVVGDIEGQRNVPSQKASRKTYDDRFSIEVLVICWAEGTDDSTDVEVAAETLGDLVHDTLANNVHLAGLDGNGLPGVVAATVGSYDGPNVWNTPEGLGAAMRLGLDVHARIT